MERVEKRLQSGHGCELRLGREKGERKSAKIIDGMSKKKRRKRSLFG